MAGEDTESIMSAMRNLDRALSADSIIKVSATVQMGVLGSNFPPFAGSFSQGYMAHLAQYLQSTGAPTCVPLLLLHELRERH